MAINIPIPSQETFNERGIPDIQETFMNGLMNYIRMSQARNAPAMDAANLQSAQAKANMAQQQAQLYGQEAPIEMDYKKAKTQDLIRNLTKQPELKGVAAEFDGIQRIKKQYGANSSEYQIALASFMNKHKVAGIGEGGENDSLNAPTANFATGQINTPGPLVPGMNAGAPMVETDPATEALVGPLGGRTGNVGAALINGSLVTKPTTPTLTKNQAQARANLGRELAAQTVKQPYLGLGAGPKQALDLVLSLFNNKDAATRLKNAAVAQRLIPEVSAFQLASQGVPATVTAMEHQKSAITQGWPYFNEFISNNLPPSVMEDAKKLHDEQLRKISGGVQSFTARGTPTPTSVIKQRPEKILEEPPNKTVSNYFGYSPSDIEYMAKKYKKSSAQVKADIAASQGK